MEFTSIFILLKMTSHREYYDTSSPIIEYHTDFDYRNHIRRIFKMDMEKMKADLAEKYDINGIDAVTLDEFMVDMGVMDNALRNLFNLTKDNSQFCELYDLAAAKMISTNREIGQSILYSYDYIYIFHPLMCAFLEYPDDKELQTKYYEQLREILLRR